MTEKKYKIIYADPPWKYEQFQSRGKKYGDASSHYQCMNIEELRGLPIQKLADDNCALFLWATYPNLPQAIELLKAWGFEYKTVAFTWVKRRGNNFYSGLGFYTNANCEICLLGIKGKFVRKGKDVKQLVISPLREHSRKPDEVRHRIVKLCGDLPRIELFARQKFEGWDVWGDEAPKQTQLLLGSGHK